MIVDEELAKYRTAVNDFMSETIKGYV